MTLRDAQILTRWMRHHGLEMSEPTTKQERDRAIYKVLDDENRVREPEWIDSSMATVIVNLDAPPDVLDREFKEWRQAAQAAHDITVAGYKVYPTIWRRDQLLAFIDLSLWARVRGGKFTDNALAEMLFPTIAGRARYIVKTVRPAADRLLSDRMRNRLFDYARCEAAES